MAEMIGTMFQVEGMSSSGGRKQRSIWKKEDLGQAGGKGGWDGSMAGSQPYSVD